MGFFRRQSSTGFGVPYAFIHGGVGFPVFVIDYVSEIFSIELLRLRHALRVAREAKNECVGHLLLLAPWKLPFPNVFDDKWQVTGHTYKGHKHKNAVTRPKFIAWVYVPKNDVSQAPS